jgi:hypothetical protein
MLRSALGVWSLVGVFLMSGCADEAQPQRTTATHDYRKCLTRNAKLECHPSLTELVVRPEWYDGESVYTTGVLGYEFEESALYSSREDYDRMNTMGAVWLRYSAQCGQCPSLVGKWVSASGTFRASERGHMGMFGGAIVDVRNVSELSDYRHIPAPAPPPRPPAK